LRAVEYRLHWFKQTIYIFLSFCIVTEAMAHGSVQLECCPRIAINDPAHGEGHAKVWLTNYTCKPARVQLTVAARSKEATRQLRIQGK
jgi:hypothetical protein